MALSLTSMAGLLPVLLSFGNSRSLFFSVKFHANLKRRDKLPLAASQIGIGAAGSGPPATAGGTSRAAPRR